MYYLDEKIEYGLGNKEFFLEYGLGKKAENVVFLFMTSELSVFNCLRL